MRAYTGDTGCRIRTVNSIVLLSNGIAFAIQTALLLLLGSCAGGTIEWYLQYADLCHSYLQTLAIGDRTYWLS